MIEPMFQEKRHHRILALLAGSGHVSTERIAKDLGVSRETVRRDVLVLETTGQLRRVHGGVKLGGPESEPPLQQRLQTNTLQKRAVVQAAARLLQPGQSVFIDAGSTVSMLAEELASLQGLTIITNSFDVALKLAAPGYDGAPRHQVHLLGGRPRPSLAATYGDSTVAELMRWRPDWAMLSPVGIDATLGASSFEPAEAELARAMVRQAHRSVLLADDSKIGVQSRLSFCTPDQVHGLITNRRAARYPALLALQQAGCAITLA